MRAFVMFAALGACGHGDLPALPTDAPWTCDCQYGQPYLAGAVTITGPVELSGLAASLVTPDTVWAENDSGKPRLYELTAYGAAKGIALLTGATVIDWEDIAAAPCGAGACVYIGDIGDNTLIRTSVQIYEVDDPGDFRGEREVSYRAFDITYPDGPHNGEALFIDPRDGASYVITKQASNPSTVFLMPRVAAMMSTAVPIAMFSVPSGNLEVTAADLRVDDCGVRLLVRTYSSLWELSAPAGTSIAELFATTPVSVPVAAEPHGEAVAFLPSGHAYLTLSEGPYPGMYRVDCE